MKQSRLETKLDLMAIIDAAFYDYDDYASECHNKGIEVHECVEAFVADAIIKAGYRRVTRCENCMHQEWEQHSDGKKARWCSKRDIEVCRDFYCADGTPKKERE